MNVLSPPTIEALRPQLTGALLLPGDNRYEAAKAPWLRVIDQHPALVIEVANADDVVLGLGFAQAHGLPLGVQSTGHGIAKACDGGVSNQACLVPTGPFMLHLVTPVDEHNEATVARITQEIFVRLAPLLTGERNYNFLRGDEQAQVPQAFTESAFARLRQLKRRLDPQNVFQLNLNIEPALSWRWRGHAKSLPPSTPVAAWKPYQSL